MPIYEYERPDGTTFEVTQSFSDEPLEKDPESGDPVRRVLHPPAVHFKGKGFYNTDYGTRRRQREMAAQSGSSGNGSSANGSSSEGAKPAADSSGASAGGSSSTPDSKPSKTESGPAKPSKPETVPAK